VKSVILILIAGYLIFELMEHAIFPLIWFIKNRNRKPLCGITNMTGRVGEIRYWQKSEGKILVNGELWRAVSKFPLSAGDKAVIEHVDGLTVSVMPYKDGVKQESDFDRK